MQVENRLKCDVCKTFTLIYIFDTIWYEIRFYPHVNTSNISIALHKIEITKKPSKKRKNHFDYYITCPRCGKKASSYTTVPKDWMVYAPDNAFLVSIPLDKLREAEK